MRSTKAAIALVMLLLRPCDLWAQAPPSPAPETPSDPTPETPPVPTPPAFPPAATAPESAPAGRYPGLSQLDLPEIDADTLAMGSQFDLVAGTFNFTHVGRAGDGIDNELATWGLALAARYFRSLEKTQFGYSTVVDGSEALSRVAIDGGSLFTNNIAFSMLTEGRYYALPQNPFFVHGNVDFNTNLASLSTSGTTNDQGDSLGLGQLGFTLGVGAGRILAIDPVVRLHRLEKALTEEGALSGSISAETGTEIIRAWYALRNEFSHYPMLGHTLQQLSGQMADPLNARAMYKALAVLSDPFIVDRRHGWEARVGVGVLLPFIYYDDIPNSNPDAVGAILGSAQYELPIGTDRQLSVRGKLFIDMDAPEVDMFGGVTAAPPWSVRGFATHTQVFYNDLYDATGALTLSGEAGLSGVRWPSEAIAGPAPDLGLDVVAVGAYSRALNRGSFATGSLTLTARNDGIYQFLVNVGLTWGVAGGFFTPYTSMPGLR